MARINALFIFCQLLFMTINSIHEGSRQLMGVTSAHSSLLLMGTNSDFPFCQRGRLLTITHHDEVLGLVIPLTDHGARSGPPAY